MVIGIIGAMNEEIIELKSVMTGIKEERLGNLTFFKGELKGKRVVLVEGGIGKVNGAICATLMKNHFNVDKLFFTGVAGGVNPEINIGDIVVGTDLVEHDFDCSAFGYELGKIPRMEEYQFKADENLRRIAVEVATETFGKEKVWEGRIVSGDQFIASPEKIKWLKARVKAVGRFGKLLIFTQTPFLTTPTVFTFCGRQPPVKQPIISTI